MVTSLVLFGCLPAPWLASLFSLENYWYAIVSAVIGAGLGIAWTIRHFRNEQQRARQTCLRRLRASINFNLERLEQARGQLADGIVPSYPLDTAQMNHWIAQAHDFLPEELLRHLDWQRFQLDHISAKFYVANTVVVSTAGATNMQPAQTEYYRALAESLREHVDITLRELPPYLDKLPKTI